MPTSVTLSTVLLATCLLLVIHIADSTGEGSRLHTRQSSCTSESYLQSNYSEGCTAWHNNFTNYSSRGDLPTNIFLTQLYDLLCEPCGRLYIEFIRMNCDVDLAGFYELHCARNASNVRCEVVEYEIFSPNRPNGLILDEFIARCNPSSVNPTTCASECGTLLETLRDDHGCCLNNILNNTYITLVDSRYTDLVNYTLWSRCNVNPPGFCPLESDAAANPNLAAALLSNNILYVVLMGAAMLLMV